MAKVKVTFFVPIRDNDGRPLQAEIDDLEMELIVTFVGWTFQGYVKGSYRMSDGGRSLDVNASYFIVIEESRLNELVAILEAFLNETMQEALYLEIQRDFEFKLITRGQNDDAPTG